MVGMKHVGRPQRIPRNQQGHFLPEVGALRSCGPKPLYEQQWRNGLMTGSDSPVARIGVDTPPMPRTGNPVTRLKSHHTEGASAGESRLPTW